MVQVHPWPLTSNIIDSQTLSQSSTQILNSKQNINLNIDTQAEKTDKELTDELDILLKDFRPQDMPKTSKEWSKWNEDNPNTHAEEERLAELEKKH